MCFGTNVRMSLDHDGSQREASLPEVPSLSAGFWDAFASGLMWAEPVLAVVSYSPLGTDHYLYVAPHHSLHREASAAILISERGFGPHYTLIYPVGSQNPCNGRELHSALAA